MQSRALLTTSLVLIITFCCVSFTAALAQTSDEDTQNDEIMTIAEARQQPLGTVVTVTGWVTVTDEFRGPVYFQDETGGMAWYNGPLMRVGDFDIDVAHGDSLVVTGTLSQFGATPTLQNGLRQITNEQSFTIYPEGNRQIDPLPITVEELNSTDFEGQLVQIENAYVDHLGELRGNTSYTVVDNTGEGIFRIDRFTGIQKTPAPNEPTTLVGVAGMFQGNAQLIPRNASEANPIPRPGDEIPQSETFDVVTWNIEWFGSNQNGPSDVERQIENVIEVITTINADLYTFQEIANASRWVQLVNALEDYDGFRAGYSISQNTAFLYRTDTIEPIASGLLETGQSVFDWASRLPLWFNFNVTIGGETREVHAYGVHAKAFPDAESYQRRVNASTQLKSYLDNNRLGENIIFFGDFNDKLLSSTRTGFPSPYANFVSDQNYLPITATLEEGGMSSFRFVDIIDHIIVSGDLANYHISGSERVENTNAYIIDFEDTTSDHYPVWTRFDLSKFVSVYEPENDLPKAITLAQNYPNPFNPSTTISFELPESQQVSLTVYDVTGRRVATLLNGETRQSGEHTITFDASNLASGIYLYRLSTAAGQTFTNKMMLVK